MPRLFAAIDLSESAKDAIAAHQSRLAGRLPGTPPRWVRREQFHLTLVFVGEVGADEVSRFVHTMSNDMPMAPFRISIGGVGTFPPRGAPRALWLGLSEGCETVVALQRIVEERLMACGATLEHRLFSPHLTIGRWGHARAADRPRDTGDAGVVAADEVRDVVLFQSHITSRGSSYRVLARATLRAT